MLSKFGIDIFDSLETMCFGNHLLTKKTRENMTVLRSSFPGQGSQDLVTLSGLPDPPIFDPPIPTLNDCLLWPVGRCVPRGEPHDRGLPKAVKGRAKVSFT